MKVIIPDDYQDAVRRLNCFAKLKEHDVIIYNDTVKDLDALAERFADAEALILIRERTRITGALLERLPKLRLISQTGAGFASHIDLAACTRRKVAVAAGGRGTHSTAELTWGLIFSVLRHIPHEVQGMKAGNWQTTVGTDVHGKTLGVYAYGNIGSQVALAGKAFGMRVLAWGREGSAARARADGVAVAKSREDLFEVSDVLSLHIRLTGETRGIVTAADLARMKPTAVLINTSRAGLIEEGALVAALRAGRPGFAGVDVYEEEPVLGADHPLLHMENVVCTPHLGYVTWETFEAYLGQAFDRVNAFAAGRPVDVQNPEVLA